MPGRLAPLLEVRSAYAMSYFAFNFGLKERSAAGRKERGRGIGQFTRRCDRVSEEGPASGQR